MLRRYSLRIVVYYFNSPTLLHSSSSKMSVQIGEYDPAVLCAAAVNTLVYSVPGTIMKEVMKCAGFKEVDMASDTYRKRIERLKKKIITSHPSQITVMNRSMSLPSVLTIGYVLDVIVALISTTIRLDIVSKLTNKKIEFRQSHCFQKV